MSSPAKNLCTFHYFHLRPLTINDLATLNGLLCCNGHLYKPADWAGFPEVAAIPGSEITEEALGEKVAMALPGRSLTIASPSGQASHGVVSSPGSGSSLPGDS